VPAAATALSEPLPSLAPVPAAKPDADAELFKLIEEHRLARLEEQRLYKVFQPFEKRHIDNSRRHQAAMPEVLKVRPDDRDIGIPIRMMDTGAYDSAGKVGGLQGEFWHHIAIEERSGIPIGVRCWNVEPTPAARTRADEIIAAFDEWKRAEPRKSRGYRKVGRAQQAAAHRQARLEDRIFATLARTPAGLAAKARLAIVETKGMDDYVAPILEHLARDAIALAANVTA
jgi:hypothetical protein